MKRRPASGLSLALLAFAGLTPLAAQDIIVSDPVPLRQPTDPLPKTFSRMHPAFPDQLRGLAEAGYVIAMRYFSAERQYLENKVQGTHLGFQSAVKDSTGRWIMNPARKGRKNVDAHLWVSVIFNPKSAGEKSPDAIPRLLVVAPVLIPKTPARPDPFVMRIPLEIDATGAITAIKPTTALANNVDQAVRASLGKWRFAPARAAGRPVAANLTVPVLCQPIDDDFLQRVPPRPISRQSLGYPPELEDSGLKAEVTLRFDIDASGRTQNPIVQASTHPLFDAIALQSLRDWKYHPATVNGRAVPVTGLQTTFRYDTRAGGRELYTFRDVGDQTKLPPHLRYDTSAVLRGAVAPVYPYTLRRDGISGRAKVSVAVDTRGRVGAVKIISADRPEFGRALVAALENFTFEPALRNGEPVPQLLHFDPLPSHGLDTSCHKCLEMNPGHGRLRD